MGEMRVLGVEGDQKVVWDPSNDDEVEVAEMTFDKLKAKNYKAYSVDKQGKPKKEISKFSSKAGSLIMVPAITGG
jgi:hypothetical protein